MRGDIELAGFVMTSEEWQALDATSRNQLIAVAARRDDAAPPPDATADACDGPSAGHSAPR
ncbi:MAG: hypothetical protein ACTHU0_03725 [Kofleriaceae bacterium]